jgi:membrane fusion protein, heavy metal efflux system
MSHEINRSILLTAIVIALGLPANSQTVTAESPPLLVGIVGKAPVTKDKDDDDKGGSKNDESRGPSPAPVGKDQAEGKENELARPSPNGPKNNEQEENKKEENVKEPNEIGRIELDEKKAENAHLELAVAGPAKIQSVLRLYGKIAMNEDAVANVSPRFPGLVKAVSGRLGDRVEKGQALAVVESNDSLRSYQVTSEIAGTIIKKEVTIGEVVRDDKPIFTVADLSTVWIDFSVFPQDFKRVRLGQTARITYAADVKPISGKISYISPTGSENTQSLLARAVAPNLEGLLRPGLFVMGDLETDEVEVPIAVRPEAIQTLNEKTAIFVVEGKAFEAREVKLGARDENHVQVLSGLNAGDHYVSANSFLLKAELAKGEAGEED